MASYYEVQFRAGANWEKVSSHNDKTGARTAAQDLIKIDKHDAVRVLEKDGDDAKQVFFHEKTRTKLTLKIGEIAEAPLCTAASDLLGATARRTILALLHDFLASRGITAFELVHRAAHLMDLEAEKDLFAKATQRVAALQARAAKGDPKARAAELAKYATELAKAADAAGDIKAATATIAAEGLAAARSALEAAGKTAPNALGTALAAHLADAPDWETKLARLAALLERDAAKETRALVDEIMAELIEAVANLGFLLGMQSDPGGAMVALTELARGGYKIRPDQDKAATIAALNTVLGKFPLRLTQAALLAPVVAALRGTKPITKIGGAEDYKAFFMIVAAARAPGGLCGGGPMAEAVIRRIRVVMGSPGRDLAVDEAVATTLDNLTSRAEKIGFLLDLSATETGAKCKATATRLLNAQANGMKTIRDLIPAGNSPQALASAFEDVFRRLAPDTVPADFKGIVLKALARVSAAAKQPATA